MNDDLQKQITEAVQNPQNIGEMENADAVGTVGSADCGDMLRMWVKFGEKDGRKVIDKATFQTFGCETAIAVASVATSLIAGKTAEEALAMSAQELAAPLGALPPMKIHCSQLVEGALRAALAPKPPAPNSTNLETESKPEQKKAPTLFDQLHSAPAEKKLKVVIDKKA